MGAYPTLPLSLILSAVEQYQRGLELCGDGAVERAAMDVAVDHNLSSALQSLAASGRVPRLADT